MHAEYTRCKYKRGRCKTKTNAAAHNLARRVGKLCQKLAKYFTPRNPPKTCDFWGRDSKCRTACRLPGMVRCGYFLIARRMRLAMYLCPLTVGWASVAVMAKGMGT